MIKLSYLRKVFVILIIITPIFTDLACKKQPKCGCGKDLLFTLTERNVYVYYDAVAKSASFTYEGDPYSTYYFCNPEDMMSTLTQFQSGQLLLLSGRVYYECNYLLNASNNPYYAQVKVYMVEVTDVKEDLYGK
jgi:hypothetical protein